MSTYLRRLPPGVTVPDVVPEAVVGLLASAVGESDSGSNGCELARRDLETMDWRKLLRRLTWVSVPASDLERVRWQEVR